MQQLFGRRLDRPCKQFLSFILLFSLSSIAVSCTATSPNTNSQASPASSPQAAVTETLNVAVIPWQSPAEQEKKLQPLADYLQQTMKRPVKFQIAKDYATAVNLLVEEKVEMAYLAALTYVKAHDRNAKIAPLVLPIDATSGRPWYTSVIVADASKDIQSLTDLKGKRFAFVSPSSTSGFLMPLNAFQAKGIDPTRDFSRIRYAGSHDKTQTALANGEVDAIADDKSSFRRVQAEGKLPAANYKIIWESDPIPTGPVVINTSKFAPQEIAQLQQALIDAPVGVVDVSGSKSAGYTLAKDADFEPVRQIHKRLKSITIAER
ncbi:phosphate/phosphite/phosphonate ABC transporter substrate-binding protein [Phormidium sp. FACHB-592]|uniref:Phosphate/phosphite/phosphonate ABC transporter substrate-binding protein n=1 Tax=Stenomitos frigidus AS-A4 TaxID=2933935 RepID=A0ABV0KRW9_9CYAN|nr:MULTISPECIES: phosphate/phosphite/phosphonate ABC transporter substrate-binding protein [Cyanophyceae]MBD2034880.1 phosphate/phosphite/phosphonate ABC transporter substrate-binding protein [Leptolyngbya sp. FACHB-321]MBD2074211.1 phosphate/phosphite/phosphonate ABC transporter substrate-binding protein [Phormidium sp. FACHB-592]